MIHLLREYMVLKQIFNAVGIAIEATNHASEWEERLVSSFLNMDENKRILFAITCWEIWSSRNKIHHQGEKLNIIEIIAFINAYKLESESLSQ